MVAAIYGSTDPTIWTPSQQGSYPIPTEELVFWVDGERTASVVTSSGYVNSWEDAANSILLANVVGDTEAHPKYGVDPSSLINNRNAVWFWEDSLQYNPISTLTSSYDSYSHILPVHTSSRSIFLVTKVNGGRCAGGDTSTPLYGYGEVLSPSWNGGVKQSFGLEMVTTGPPGDKFAGTFPMRVNTFSHNVNLLNGITEPYVTIGETDLWYQEVNSVSDLIGLTKNGDYNTIFTASASTNMTSSNGSIRMVLGNNVDTSAYASDFVLAEFLTYNVVLADTDRQRVEGYLAHKWGTTGSLPANHPYKSEAPSNYADPWPFHESSEGFVAQEKNFTHNLYRNSSLTYNRTISQVPFSLATKGAGIIKKGG